VNSKVENGITSKLGEWNEDASFTIFPMDAFEVVLGKDFMKALKENVTRIEAMVNPFVTSLDRSLDVCLEKQHIPELSKHMETMK